MWVNKSEYWWIQANVHLFLCIFMPAKKGKKCHVFAPNLIQELYIHQLQVFVEEKVRGGNIWPLRGTIWNENENTHLREKIWGWQISSELPEKVWRVLRDEEVGGPEAKVFTTSTNSFLRPVETKRMRGGWGPKVSREIENSRWNPEFSLQ